MKLPVLLVALAACASGRAPAPQAPAAAPSPVARFVDDFFAARFAFSPSNGTRVGLHDYDAQLEDRSRARIDARVAELKGLRARLAAFDRKALSFDEAIDADALAHSIDGELLSLEAVQRRPRNPMPHPARPHA